MPESFLMTVRALTPLHPGAGTSVGVIDMPVQREAHTLWPMIQSSTLKGKLRDLYRLSLVANTAVPNATDRDSADKHNDLTAIFGPANVGGTAAAGGAIFGGALTLQDARLLAYPVRSAKGVFAWLTCPYLLERLIDDLAVLPNQTAVAGSNLASVSPGNDVEFLVTNAACNLLCPGLTPGGQGQNQPPPKVVLEDFVLERDMDPARQRKCDQVASWYSTLLNTLGISNRLVIVSNDVFTHIVRFGTSVVTRNKLDSTTKRVVDKALFNIELLSAETLMYAMVLAEGARGGTQLTAGQVKAAILGLISPQPGKPPVRTQIGGDETTGKGWCELTARP